MSSRGVLVGRSVAAIAVVAVVALIAVRLGDDAAPTPTTTTTSTTLAPAAAAAATPAELADAFFPPTPEADAFREVSAMCSANLDIEGGVPMEHTGDHGAHELTAEDLAFTEGQAADGRYERRFGGINPRVEVSSMPFAQAPTDAERERAADFVDEVAAAIEEHGWEDPAEAIRDGYRPMQQCNTHLVNVEAVLDGRDLDPDRPEFLVIEPGDDGQNHFHSVMFMVGANDAHGPQPFGPLAVWHYHESPSCMIDGVLLISTGASTSDCPAGTQPYEHTAEMLHVAVSATPFSPDM